VSVMRSEDGTPVRIDVFPIRSDGRYAMVQIEFTVAGPMPPAGVLGIASLPLTSVLSAGASDFPDDVRLVDLASQTVYQLVRSADGKGYASAWLDRNGSATYSGLFGTDRPERVLMTFPAPTSATVDVSIPCFGLVTGVPVETGADLAAELALLADSGGIAYPDPSPVDPTGYAVPLRTYRTPYDDNTVVRQENQTVTITLDSAVLFAMDRYEVSSPAAQAALASAADQIKAAATGGVVHVIGHTDDQGSVEHGYVLSRQRAEAVAAALGPLLGPAYTYTTEGKGYDAPLVPGTSDEARAANRRVELQFTGNVATTVTETLPLPPTDAPTASGVGAWVEFPSQVVEGDTYQLRVDKAVRTGQSVVVDYEFGFIATRGTIGFELEATYGAPASRAGLSGWGYGTNDIALLTPDGRLFPYDFVRPDYDPAKADDRIDSPTEPASALADNIFGVATHTFAAGDPPLRLTAVYPDTGQATVTLDLGGRFRITDIPVTDDASQLNAPW